MWGRAIPSPALPCPPPTLHATLHAHGDILLIYWISSETYAVNVIGWVSIYATDSSLCWSAKYYTVLRQYVSPLKM